MNKIIGLFSNEPQEAEQRIREALAAGYNQPVLFTGIEDHTDYTKQFGIYWADDVKHAQELTIKKFGKRADFGVWEDSVQEYETCPLPQTVAVVITSHNYGHYLQECLDSVLNQVRPADEIIVVDDASTDNTREVAAGYLGVKYLRVENRSALLSRWDGVLQTTSEVVLFVDADDILPPDYLERGMREFTRKTVGVVYADHQYFGNSDHRTNFPAYNQDRLFQGPNFVSTCSLVRRETLLLCDAWRTQVDESHLPEDYWMFQRIALDGWEFRKQKAVLQYRRHVESMSQTRKPIEAGLHYYLAQGIQYQTITLFIPLAGRNWAWSRLSKFLKRQTWPHDRIRLVLCDTSQDPEFTGKVKRWLAKCDYTDVRHFQLDAGTPGLADRNRRERENYYEVKQAVCLIYNQLRLLLDTPYCWILEDDIIPPDDVLERLLKRFRSDVGAVTAPHQSRFNGMPVVWLKDSRIQEPGEGVTEVYGSGFGCLVVRQELIKKHLLPIQSNRQDLDPYFFESIGDEWKRLCDWSCACEHWEQDQVFRIGDN